MFYTYMQNNSGGSFIINDKVTEYVIIEANKKAEEIGIYFDGLSDGLDCNCCGERWDKFPYEYSSPKIYNRDIETTKPYNISKVYGYAIIYFQNGRIAKYF